ncbi:MAG: CBS domain-containing protein [Methanocellales archaeon]|nr:CBS domain-containing protein [Methanocellales archaeon]MDD3291737.1 CBS domain-containing protein [Methanocellales archaeon]MDD5235087.1 CBS domain-containing protein [Methanocellales archaeon]MDD5485225.1 CBS domain-containing protein [Methanocellales archaeon]
MRGREGSSPFDRGPVEFKSRVSSRPGDVMMIASKDVVTVPPTMTIMGIVKTLVTYGFRRIPIADAGTRRLVGIVTSMDLIDFFGGGVRHNLVENKYGGNLLAAINAEAREIMESDVITLTEDKSLKDALNTMIRHKTGGLPIVNPKSQIVGIISERDFLGLIAGKKAGKSVSEYMSKSVVTAPPNMSLKEATKVMVSNVFRRLPVVVDNILLGMINATDVVKFLGGGEVFNELITGHVDEAFSLPIKTLMTSDVVTIGPDVDIGIAAEMMMKKEVGSLPVLKEGKLVGIITESDFLRALA